MEVLFEYPWLPVKCNNCKKEGHTSKDCTKKIQEKPVIRKEWQEVPNKRRNKQPIVEPNDSPQDAQESINNDLLLANQSQTIISQQIPAKDIQEVQPTPVLVGSVQIATSPTHPVPITNSFALLSSEQLNINGQDGMPLIERKRVRAASQGVPAVTKALLPRPRQSRKSSNSSGEAPSSKRK